MECPAEDRIRYVKVQFLTLVYENERTIGNTRVYLDDKLPDPSCELELCRFRLQAGARLRNTYENFSDCVTEFDTIHLVEVPGLPRDADVTSGCLKAVRNGDIAEEQQGMAWIQGLP